MIKTIPEFRFKGFSEEWEEKTLGDVAKVYDGTHQTPQYTDSGVPFISVENINDIYNSGKYISQEDFQKDFKRRAEKGDIFMTRITAGVIGNTAIMSNDTPLAYYVSLALLKINSEKIETLFLNASIQSSIFKKELNKRIIHTAFPKKINLSEIGKCKIPYTYIIEQQKIGELFKQLDDVITFRQQFIEQQQQYKKAMLQKMFPQQAEHLPKVRFEGFSENWKKVVLGSVIQKQIKGKAQLGKLLEGEVEYLDANRLNGGIPFKSNGVQDVSEHEILILWDGSKAGTVYKGFCGVLGSTLKAYSVDGKNNPGFIYQQIKHNQQKIYQNYRTPNIPHVIKDFTDVFMIYITSLEEQQKISSFFKQLDDTIDLHQKKLEDYQQLKKALLQRMFV